MKKFVKIGRCLLQVNKIESIREGRGEDDTVDKECTFKVRLTGSGDTLMFYRITFDEVLKKFAKEGLLTDILE